MPIIGSILGPEILKQPVRIDNANFKLLAGSRYLVGGYGVTLESDMVVNAATSMDVGNLTASTLYYVYLVVSGGTVSVKLSLSATAPTGYLAYKKIGYLQTTVASFLIMQDLSNYGKLGETVYLNNNIAPFGFISALGSVLGRSLGDSYFPLFEYLWGTATNTATNPYYISAAKGTNAITDWNAGKTITIDESGLFTRAYKSGVTNVVGQKQDDALQGHNHQLFLSGGNRLNRTDTVGSGGASGPGYTSGMTAYPYAGTLESNGTNGTPRTSNETRPVNVAKYVFIRYSL